MKMANGREFYQSDFNNGSRDWQARRLMRLGDFESAAGSLRHDRFFGIGMSQ